MCVCVCVWFKTVHKIKSKKKKGKGTTNKAHYLFDTWGKIDVFDISSICSSTGNERRKQRQEEKIGRIWICIIILS